MTQILELLPLFIAYFGLPVAISLLVARANWREIANAYCVWLSVLLISGFAMGNTIVEKLGWPMIFAMFCTTPAIPILIWIFRLIGFRMKWFAD